MLLTRDWIHLFIVALALGGLLASRAAIGWLNGRVDASLEKNRELLEHFEGSSGARQT